MASAASRGWEEEKKDVANDAKKKQASRPVRQPSFKPSRGGAAEVDLMQYVRVRKGRRGRSGLNASTASVSDTHNVRMVNNKTKKISSAVRPAGEILPDCLTLGMPASRSMSANVKFDFCQGNYVRALCVFAYLCIYVSMHLCIYVLPIEMSAEYSY
jgi:hypothetical protein